MELMNGVYGTSTHIQSCCARITAMESNESLKELMEGSVYVLINIIILLKYMAFQFVNMTD